MLSVATFLLLAGLEGPSLAFVPVASGFHHPLDLSSPPGDLERLFVCEQGGSIWIIKNGQRLKKPFLDVSDLSTPWGSEEYSEQGLLGLAFHPRYRENGRFFVHYTDYEGDTALAEYRVSEKDPNLAQRRAIKILLTADQPYANHNGGQIVFGPDGFLYMGLGDGGAGGDPQGNGQDRSTFLGKILRLDVDKGEPYGIPDDGHRRNWTGNIHTRPEIWALGLRNPWRFSFDSATGDLWIADVGQNRWEEVNVEWFKDRGYKNYGWRILEADECYKADTCDRTDMVSPVFIYDHEKMGCSVTGGYVYRGSKIPALQGTYICGDYCSAKIWALKAIPGNPKAEVADWSDTLNPGKKAIENISAFGVDGVGELYVADYGRGKILRLETLP